MNKLPFEKIERKILIRKEAETNPEFKADNSVKTLINYGIIGFSFGIFICVLSLIAYSNKTIENLVNILIILPFELYLKIYPLFNLCPYDLKSKCILHGLGLTIITALIYYGILGFILGYIIEKIKEK